MKASTHRTNLRLLTTSPDDYFRWGQLQLKRLQPARRLPEQERTRVLAEVTTTHARLFADAAATIALLAGITPATSLDDLLCQSRSLDITEEDPTTLAVETWSLLNTMLWASAEHGRAVREAVKLPHHRVQHALQCRGKGIVRFGEHLLQARLGYANVEQLYEATRWLVASLGVALRKDLMLLSVQPVAAPASSTCASSGSSPSSRRRGSNDSKGSR